jgi:hypothetical protein
MTQFAPLTSMLSGCKIAPKEARIDLGAHGNSAQKPLFDSPSDLSDQQGRSRRRAVRQGSAAETEARSPVSGEAQKWAQELRAERVRGRLPMFVLGAGVSYGVVPLLKDIGAWFVQQLPNDDQHKKAHSLAQNLATGKASRGEVAELFSLLQSEKEESREIWRRFSEAFLLGSYPKIKMGDHGQTPFNGLLKADPSQGHRRLATLAADHAAWVLSLNFDGLTVKALIDGGAAGVALHSAEDVRRYFSALDASKSIPAVIKVRGDVFYARCDNPLCPAAASEQALDRLKRDPAQSDLRCPSCHAGQLLLQFLFPGFRSKEEAAYPILWEARGFLGPRVSAIIIVGLSGRWDRYLLEFLFDWAREREVPVLDVKPNGEDAKVIESFWQTYFKGRVNFHFINATAEEWLPEFCRKFDWKNP